MNQNIFLILLFYTLAVLTNIILFRVVKKRNLIYERLIFLFYISILIYVIEMKNIYQIMYVMFIYLTLFCSYSFFVVAPLSGSPTIEIIKIIYDNNKITKKKLLKIFLKKSFLNDRIKKLINEKYLLIKKNKIIYTQKNKMLHFVFQKIESLGNKNLNRNG